MTSNPTPPEGLPAQPARRRHHWLRNAFIVIGVLVVLVIVLVAVGSGHNGGTGSTASPPSSSPAAQAVLPWPIHDHGLKTSHLAETHP
jgi:hypothetical protein